jgi:hypothetical protein
VKVEAEAPQTSGLPWMSPMVLGIFIVVIAGAAAAATVLRRRRRPSSLGVNPRVRR